MREIKLLTETDFEPVLLCYTVCFAEEDYFRELFRSDDNASWASVQKNIIDQLGPSIRKVLQYGCSYGCYIDGTLVGILLGFDYRAVMTKNQRLFDELFADSQGNISHMNSLHGPVRMLGPRIYYILAVAVYAEYRRQHIASDLVERALADYPGWGFASDVTNMAYLPTYSRRGFSIRSIGKDYKLVLRQA